MTKKEVIKNLIFVGFIASLIFILNCIVIGEPYIGIGDYYDQQIAFYKHAHEFVKNGNWLWDWNSELGTEFIPTYAFYLTFSPFFLITLLFPNNWVILIMPILNILKIILADATALLYFKDKFKTKELVFLAAFLYAFSGWMFDSLFFNHFIEVMAIFPLYLWAFDKVVTGEKKYLFGVLTAASLLINYFFWFGEAVFIALYFIVRVIFDKNYKVKKVGLLRFIIEGLLGVGLTCIFLFPIANTVFQNPRANAKLVTDIFSYENIQMYFSIIKSALQFPNPLMWQGDWLRPLEFGCPSQTLYIAGIGIFLIPVFFIKSKERWLKMFLGLMFVFSMVPILNSSFALFSNTYYARWFYMLTFFLIWAGILVIDNFEIKEISKLSIISTAVMVVVYVICAFAGYKLHVLGGGTVFIHNIYFSIITFLVSVGVFLACIKQKNLKNFCNMVIISSSIFILMSYTYSCYYYNNLELYQDDSYKYIDSLIEQEMTDNDEFYRIHNDKYPNTGLLYNKSSVLGYNSIVPASIYDFYTLIGDTREVKSISLNKDSKLLNVFSVKYIYDEENKKWIENQDYLPMGIIFEDIEGILDYKRHVVSENDLAHKLLLEKTDYNKYSHLDKENAILENSQVLQIDDIYIDVKIYNDKEIYTYFSDTKITIPDICNNSSKITINGNNLMVSSKNSCIDGDLFVGQKGDIEIIIQRDNPPSVKAANLTNMNFTQYGFSADSNLESENLVFFTIPYTDLWDAYIDGEKVEIIKGDNAFVVLHIPEGEHHIELIYNTKYYKYGAVVSVISLVLFAGYILLTKKQKLSD